MNSYNCTCNGLNTNCFHCDGTGLVESKTPIIGRPQRNLANAVNASEKQRQKNTSGTAIKNLDGNIREYTNCAQCGALVRTSRIQQHRQKAHPDRHDTNEENPKKQDLSNPLSDFVIPPCPICKKQKASLTELRIHLIAEHGRHFTALNKPKKKSTNGPGHSKKKMQGVLTKTKPPLSKIAKRQEHDDVDALDHPSRLPGSYGSGKRR